MQDHGMPYDEQPAVSAIAGGTHLLEGEHLQPFDLSSVRPRERSIFEEFRKTARRVRADNDPEVFFAVLCQLFPPKRSEKKR